MDGGGADMRANIACANTDQAVRAMKLGKEGEAWIWSLQEQEDTRA
jgi:hypothetical protein